GEVSGWRLGADKAGREEGRVFVVVDGWRAKAEVAKQALEPVAESRLIACDDDGVPHGRVPGESHRPAAVEGGGMGTVKGRVPNRDEVGVAGQQRPLFERLKARPTARGRTGALSPWAPGVENPGGEQRGEEHDWGLLVSEVVGAPGIDQAVGLPRRRGRAGARRSNSLAGRCRVSSL